MDALASKTAVSALIVLVYALSLYARRITPLQVAATLGYLLIGFRLGYDTLMYRWLIEGERLDHYGPLWAAIGTLYSATGLWWAPHTLILTLLVVPLVALARRTPWPSLALAMMATLPGMGFDYLALLRQALATGMLIAFHLLMLRRSWWLAAVVAGAAYLAHPAAAFALAVILLIHLRHNLKHLLVVLGAAAAGVALAAIAAPSFIDGQINNAGYLLARYLVIDATAEGETGAKLALFWGMVVMMPMLSRALLRPSTVLESSSLTTLGFVAAYGLLVTVSGATVRLLWLLLPLLISLPLAVLVRTDLPYLVNLCRGFVIVACTGAAIYVVQIAPEFYWAGDYPHEVHFAAE